MKRRLFLISLLGAPFMPAASKADGTPGSNAGEEEVPQRQPFRSADGRMVIDFEAGTINIHA